MLRLNDQHYERIAELEQLLVPYAGDDRRPAVYIDTWRSPVDRYSHMPHILFVSETALYAGPGRDEYMETLLTLYLDEWGRVLDLDGLIPGLGDDRVATLDRVASLLAELLPIEQD